MLKRWRKDQRGVAAVEFALLAPLMVLIYFGMADLTEGLMANRMVGHVASTVGDLTAQSNAVTPAQVGDIITVGQQMLAPFPTTGLKIRISSVTADANDVPKVDWSQASGGLTALPKGSTVALPNAAKAKPTDPTTPFIPAGGSVIMAETQYNFTSPIGYYLPGVTAMTDTEYLSPRGGAEVACTAC
jgi:Flp pilus assembly protein TadG